MRGVFGPVFSMQGKGRRVVEILNTVTLHSKKIPLTASPPKVEATPLALHHHALLVWELNAGWTTKLSAFSCCAPPFSERFMRRCQGRL
jgi:hypothetical protein